MEVHSFISSFRKGSFHTKRNRKLLARGPLLSILGLSTQNKYQIYRRREQESILHLIPSLQTKRRSISPLYLFILFLLPFSIFTYFKIAQNGKDAQDIQEVSYHQVQAKILQLKSLTIQCRHACSDTMQRLSTLLPIKNFMQDLEGRLHFIKLDDVFLISQMNICQYTSRVIRYGERN